MSSRFGEKKKDAGQYGTSACISYSKKFRDCVFIRKSVWQVRLELTDVAEEFRTEIIVPFCGGQPIWQLNALILRCPDLIDLAVRAAEVKIDTFLSSQRRAIRRVEKNQARAQRSDSIVSKIRRKRFVSHDGLPIARRNSIERTFDFGRDGQKSSKAHFPILNVTVAGSSSYMSSYTRVCCV